MRDRSNILVLGALIALFVALSTLDVSFFTLGISGRQLLPFLVIGIIVLFLMRSGCCGAGSCGTAEEDDETQGTEED
jgi:hypothetical protein